MSFGSVGTLIPTMMTRSKYALIGSVRAIKAVCFSEILTDTLVFVYLIHSRIITTSNMVNISFYVYILLFSTIFLISLFISSGRSPFDLAESESELIAGNMTEVGGVSFSFLLLVDYCELLVLFLYLVSFPL